MPLYRGSRRLILRRRAATTTWDPSASGKSAGISLDATNLIASQNVGLQSESVRTVANHNTGKYFFSIVVNSPNDALIAIVNSSYVLNAGSPASSVNAVCMAANGTIFYNSGGIGSWAGYSGTSDVVDIELDIDALFVRARTNGGAWSANSSISGTVTGPYYPLIWLGQTGRSATANFGASAYPYAPSSGFLNW